VVDSRFLAVVVGGSATVEAGDTATATVTYAIRTGSGGLWFSNTGNSTIARLAAGQLHASGSPVDTTNITVTDGVLFAAFDRDENLWTSTAGSNELSRYTRDQLVAGETPTSQYTLISAALVDPRGIAFDAGGNVWVANSGNGTIVKILKQYLDVGGTSPAAVTITLTGIANPTAIAFDAAGSLWITDRSGNQVAELDATQLTTTATVVPNTILGATGGSLNHPQALAFDASGNLWVANDAPEGDGREDTIVGFGSTLLDNDGAPTPSVTITLSDDADPYGLAFDESGSLWVSLHGTSQIVSFTATQLSDGGDLTPTVTITAGAGASLNSPSALVFDPHALGLPIR
jgi:sugar lactone lactonase YvrE